MSVVVLKKNLRWLQPLLLVAPFLSKFFDVKSSLLFPPLGDNTNMFRFIALALIVVSVPLPYLFYKKRYHAKVLLYVCLSLCVSGGAYLYLTQKTVVSVHFSSGEDKNFTKGVRRTGLAEEYSYMSDSDLVEVIGLSDKQLETIFTKDSVSVNRLKLFITYVLFWMVLEVLLGLFVKEATSTVSSSAVLKNTLPTQQ